MCWLAVGKRVKDLTDATGSQRDRHASSNGKLQVFDS